MSGQLVESAGLRDRKKQQTYDDLEGAALQLVQELGYEATTVDAISARANVSPRTFFNYFSSKDDAILGVRSDGFAVGQVQECFSATRGGNAVEDCVDALIALLVPRMSPSHLRVARREVAHRIPHLRDRQMAKLSQLRESLASLVAGELVATGHIDRRGAAELASLIVGTCIIAVRAAFEDAGETTPSTAQLRRRALALLRQLSVQLY